MKMQIAVAHLSGLFLLTGSPVYGQGVAVYHSPNDSGLNEGPVAIGSAGPTTLHLYLDAGLQPSAGPEPCCSGQGDEVLGWNLTLAAVEGLEVSSVDPVGDVVVNHTPTALRMNGGEFRRGDLGPIKIADIEVQTNGSGSLSLSFGQVVGPSLTREDVTPVEIVGVPEPSTGLGLGISALGLTAVVARKRRA